MSAQTGLPGDAQLARRGHGGRRLPLAIVPGLMLMAAALVADVGAHAGVHALLEAPAHLLGVLGMVLTWIAVVADGIHRTSRPR